MNKLFLAFLVVVFIGCNGKMDLEKDEVIFEGCQYIILSSQAYRMMGIAHKGNCTNHKENRR